MRSPHACDSCWPRTITFPRVGSGQDGAESYGLNRSREGSRWTGERLPGTEEHETSDATGRGSISVARPGLVGQPSSRYASGQAPAGDGPSQSSLSGTLRSHIHVSERLSGSGQDERGSPRAPAPASTKLRSKIGTQRLETTPGSPLFTAKVGKTLSCYRKSQAMPKRSGGKRPRQALM